MPDDHRDVARRMVAEQLKAGGELEQHVAAEVNALLREWSIDVARYRIEVSLYEDHEFSATYKHQRYNRRIEVSGWLDEDGNMLQASIELL